MRKIRCSVCARNFFTEKDISSVKHGDCTNCFPKEKIKMEAVEVKPVQTFVSAEVPKDKWVASLSNGETIFETNEKDISAWQKLTNYVKEKNLRLTNLRMEVDGFHFSVPSKQQGYFQSAKSDWTMGRVDHFKGIGYVDENQKVHIIWKQVGGNKIELETRDAKIGACIFNQ